MRECLRAGWVSSLSPAVGRFEKKFAKTVGSAHAISCSSGTAALHLALKAAGVGPGDEIIIPAFAMIAVANAVTYCGARPVLVDCDPATFNLDAESLPKKAGRKTKAVIAVHTYGHPADLGQIAGFCRKRGLRLIEDAAEALGGSFQGRALGTLGDAGIYSFYANKVITTGEGGMVVTDSRALAERARFLRDFAFSKERHFWHEEVGYNYRMSGLQAAVGLAQLERLARLQAARNRNARAYRDALEGVPGLNLSHSSQGHANWVFGAVVEPKFGISRDELRGFLARQGIETRGFFIPIHRQPAYQRMFAGERYPVSEFLGDNGLYFPASSALTGKEIGYICAMVRRARSSR
ncbi:MAG: DegT/DnrJ/EryC1/StrS family aminotransferase [Elusimicrobia bacterium]|nr:DegT/DnrJ/EryC1/StrS family aminotransferase [Elusimicrobiota bacterium]